ncbi:MAG: SH3 domain-containing protein, partial [Synergistaceae bacterium]|nr:SH3 domain-containing protein [Synergistaceae bacterium]
MNGHFCQPCGVPVGADDIFCHRCGHELHVGSSEAEQAEREKKTCARCGTVLGGDDRFCGTCGTDQSEPVLNARIRTRKRSVPSGVTTHRRKRSFLFRLLSALLFWGILIGGCYAAFRYFAADIPWSDVLAVVTGRRLDTDDETALDVIPVDGSDLNSDDVGEAAMPPIAPEDVSSDVIPDAGPIPDARPVWGATDSSGYSFLSPEGVFLPGAVNAGRVRLREEPNTKARILGQFDRGSEFGITGRYSSKNEKNPWFRVSSGDIYGWMYGEYLLVTED